jgi:hypothetical protein
MKVLVACEESQAVCKAFRERGHEAYSCDIQEPSGGCPQWHILGDCLKVLDGGEFTTMDGVKHFVESWDMIIAHPPCTYLTVAGACNIPKDPTRIDKGFEARDFFMKFYNHSCPKIAIENPVPMSRFNLPPYTQIVYPYMFGEPYKKKIVLWLKGLPKLVPSGEIDKESCQMYERIYRGKRRTTSKWYNRSASKSRSKTFKGFAEAMAEQWNNL